MRLFTFVMLLFSSVSIASSPSRAVPEAFTGLHYQKAAYSESAMISAANPHAVDAGIAMLQQGGNAIDAAVAIQLMLTLVEPQSSGIGGGAFLLWYDGADKQIETFDGREKAPSKATSELFLDKNGRPIRWIEAVVGGRSVGTPGTPALLAEAHRRWGRTGWAELFEAGIALQTRSAAKELMTEAGRVTATDLDVEEVAAHHPLGIHTQGVGEVL